MHRSTPLQSVAVPGIYGRAEEDRVGLVFRERRDIAIVSVVARPGGVDGLAEAFRGAFDMELPAANKSAGGDAMTLLFAGLDRWNAVAEGVDGRDLLERLRAGLGEAAALADQSHGLCVIEMQGAHVLDVLAKGSGIDLHPQAFPVGASVATGANHLAVHLWRQSQDRVMVTVPRSFARDLFEFLSTMSLEFGYRVAGD
jgi:sarcosine oxidase subunit gamma